MPGAFRKRLQNQVAQGHLDSLTYLANYTIPTLFRDQRGPGTPSQARAPSPPSSAHGSDDNELYALFSAACEDSLRSTGSVPLGHTCSREMSAGSEAKTKRANGDSILKSIKFVEPSPDAEEDTPPPSPRPLLNNSGSIRKRTLNSRRSSLVASKGQRSSPRARRRPSAGSPSLRLVGSMRKASVLALPVTDTPRTSPNPAWQSDTQLGYSSPGANDEKPATQPYPVVAIGEHVANVLAQCEAFIKGINEDALPSAPSSRRRSALLRRMSVTVSQRIWSYFRDECFKDHLRDGVAAVLVPSAERQAAGENVLDYVITTKWQTLQRQVIFDYLRCYAFELRITGHIQSSEEVDLHGAWVGTRRANAAIPRLHGLTDLIKLRQSNAVRRVTQRLFKAVVCAYQGVSEETYEQQSTRIKVSRESYRTVFARIYQYFIPGLSGSLAVRMCDEMWLGDLNIMTKGLLLGIHLKGTPGIVTLSYEIFHYILLDLATSWCETAEEAEFLSFFSFLLQIMVDPGELKRQTVEARKQHTDLPDHLLKPVWRKKKRKDRSRREAIAAARLLAAEHAKKELELDRIPGTASAADQFWRDSSGGESDKNGQSSTGTPTAEVAAGRSPGGLWRKKMDGVIKRIMQSEHYRNIKTSVQAEVDLRFRRAVLARSRGHRLSEASLQSSVQAVAMLGELLVTHFSRHPRLRPRVQGVPISPAVQDQLLHALTNVGLSSEVVKAVSTLLDTTSANNATDEAIEHTTSSLFNCVMHQLRTLLDDAQADADFSEADGANENLNVDEQQNEQDIGPLEGEDVRLSETAQWAANPPFLLAGPLDSTEENSSVHRVPTTTRQPAPKQADRQATCSVLTMLLQWLRPSSFRRLLNLSRLWATRPAAAVFLRATLDQLASIESAMRGASDTLQRMLVELEGDEALALDQVALSPKDDAVALLEEAKALSPPSQSRGSRMETFRRPTVQTILSVATPSLVFLRNIPLQLSAAAPHAKSVADFRAAVPVPLTAAEEPQHQTSPPTSPTNNWMLYSNPFEPPVTRNGSVASPVARVSTRHSLAETRTSRLASSVALTLDYDRAAEPPGPSVVWFTSGKRTVADPCAPPLEPPISPKISFSQATVQSAQTQEEKAAITETTVQWPEHIPSSEEVMMYLDNLESFYKAQKQRLLRQQRVYTEQIQIYGTIHYDRVTLAHGGANTETGACGAPSVLAEQLTAVEGQLQRIATERSLVNRFYSELLVRLPAKASSILL
eukprot:TRINITY_DN9072_c0_g1_i1.p1 TRINITY_DN9072_c0_g1~~TRINITY_DN9072_c0_g1_i1.p1  ORF type:complete len:1258 (+),score=159.31 TRINITY_DN9072_c0_g1_i1:39-3776(+)